MTSNTPDAQESSSTTSTAPASSAATAPAVAPAKAAPPPKAAPAKAAPPPPAAPAKATPPPPAAAAKSSGGGGGMAGGAFVIAVCALLVAIGAIGVSVYSLKVARDAVSNNAETAATATAPTNTTTQPAAAAPTGTSTATASVPSVQYFSELVRAEKKIPAPPGCTSAYVDVDTMAIGTEAGHEFYISACRDPANPEIRVDRTSGASTSGSNPTPEVCASLVSGTSTAQELILTAKSGLTFCLLTNKTDATAQSLPQRMAIVEIREVGVDRSVTIAVSTFRIG